MRSGLFNKITGNILAVLITGLMFVIIGGNIYRYMNDRHDTREAVLCTINENIAFEGVVIRDESVISYSSSDMISYNCSDGGKISKGDVIARIFSNAEDAAARSRLEKTEAEVDRLRRAQNPGTTEYVRPESISSKIDDSYKLLIACANSNNFSELETQKNEMTYVMNIYDIISGQTTDFNARINELETEAVRLRQQAASSKGEVTAPETGYFVSYCDGYENTLNKSMALSMTKEDIENVIANASEVQRNVPSGYIGKMFSDYESYIVGVIDSDPRVTEDSRLKLASDQSDMLYDVKVISCKDAGGGKTVAVLSCSSLDSNIAASRIHSMQLIFDEYSGIKVPRTAIRFQGEEKGVYVILGEDITFKKINVIYEGSDFVISENTSEDDHLRLYDQILLERVSEEDVRAAGEKKKQLEELPGGESESDEDTDSTE